MGFFGGKKEKKVYKLFEQHSGVVEKTLEAFRKMFHAYLTDADNFRELSFEVHKLEHQADELRRKVEINLSDGAFLPIFRDDYIATIESMDKIADKAESTADFISLTRPEIPEEISSDMQTIAEETINAFMSLKDIINNMIVKKKALVKKTHSIESEEEMIDRIQWKLIDTVFKMDIDLARKLHLKQLIDDLATISNRIEDASDRISLMAIKQV